jgi:MoxR-like ATPase
MKAFSPDSGRLEQRMTHMALTTEMLTPGASIVVHWESNKRSDDPSSVKSNRTDKGKTKKIILPVIEGKGVQPRPGEVWLCTIDRIASPKSERKGSILVRPVTRKIEYQFEGVWIDPVKAQLIATVLQDPRRNLMFEGDQGVGKSTIAAAIAKTLGWEYRKISGGLIKKFVFMLGRYVPTVDGNPVTAGDFDPKLLEMLKQYETGPQNETGLDDETSPQGKILSFASFDKQLIALLTKHLLSNKGGGLAFKFAYSKLVEVLIEANNNPRKTFLLMIDEYTRIDEDARDALLDVIEGSQRVLRLPNGEEIVVPNNVVFMGAGNVGEGFTLRREDAAAKDRFVIVKITVMPQKEELQHCLKLYPDCPKDLLNKALTIVNQVRAARKDPKMRLSKTVSTRGAETIAMFLNAGTSIELALETAIVNQYSGNSEDGTTEAGRVANLIKEAIAKTAKG